MRKECTKCKNTKIYTEFSFDRNRKDNLNPWCKSCVKGYINTERGRLIKRRVDKKSKRKFWNYIHIGERIKEELTHTPTHGNKQLWNGIGKWARAYDNCIDCGLSVYQHNGNGLCIKCYNRYKSESMSEERRKELNEMIKITKIKSGYDQESRRKTRLKVADKFIDIARERFTDDPKINNLLKNIEK